MRRRRLGITTSADRAGRLADLAGEHGFEPVLLPCIEVTPESEDVIARAKELAESSDLIVVTSSRSITSIWPNGGMPPVEVAAVGSSTARAAEQAGASVSVIGQAGGEDLVELLADKVSGKKVFFPHADRADPVTVRTLQDLGAAVVAMPVYSVRSIAPGSDPVDVVAFGSPSAVAGWSLSRSFDDLLLGVLGASTERALLDRGYPADVVPPRPDFVLLIALLASYVRDRSPV